jgi:Tol biopolymer transport system component/DNA-binding winged helix-turn-helix (wHTH) protein
MQSSERLGTRIRFGVFEVDLQTGELRKSGMLVKLQELPFRVLAMLLERPGDIVTREDLQKRVWGNDTFVDFEHSLGTAINKIRHALADSAETPRYVETLARRGYRFIAPVEFAARNEAHLSDQQEPLPQRRPGATSRKWGWPVWVSMIAVFGLGSLITAWIDTSTRQPRLLRMVQVTNSGRVYPGDLTLESFPTLAVDASRVYFSEERAGKVVLAEMSAKGGETGNIRTPPELVGPSLADISPDGSSLLIRNHLAPEVDQELWVVPTLGGAARRVGNVLAHDATWSPDGQSILYAAGHELLLTKADGSDSHELLKVPGRAFWPRWSPDGKRLRFTELDPQTRSMALWEVAADGTNLHPLLSGWNTPRAECCGNWTPDGRFYVFQSRKGDATNIWALREKVGLFPSLGRKAFQLTAGPLNFLAPVPSRDGKKIFLLGDHARSELLKYDSHAGLFVPWLPSFSNISRVEFSQDGRWVAYVALSDGSMWRSRSDGSGPLQLTSFPMQVYMMRWSPDDKWIVFMGKEPGKPWTLYLTPAEGGTAQPLLSEGCNQGDPGWSPDGRSLVFGRLPEYMAEDSSPKKIYVLDLKTKRLETLPGSEGLFSPRWSPDGRYVAAITQDQRRLMLFNFAAQTWEELVEASINNPVWSRDAKYIYFHSFMQEGQPIYRVGIRSRKLEQIASFNQARQADVIDYTFSGLAPDDSPLVRALQWAADIYVLDWQAP